MKKKIFGVAFIIAIAVVATFNINLNKSNNTNVNLALANVEALADPENDNKCGDKALWVVDALEGWEQNTFSGKADAQGYVTIYGVKFGPYGAGASVSFTYQKGVCPYRANNCCPKSQIGKVTLL